MHGGAPSALLARAIEAAEPGAELVVTRLTIDFLSGVPLGAVEVAASVVRPGRRFQVVEATLDAGGRHACLARAVRVRRADLPRRRGLRRPAPAPLAAARGRRATCRCSSSRTGELFYPDACEIRHVGGELGSGAVAAWIRLRGEVLPGERAVAARARRGRRGLRERPELDPAVARLAVRQHRARRSTSRASRAASGSASTRARRRRRAGSACRRRRCTTSTGRSASARSRCSSSRADRRCPDAYRRRVRAPCARAATPRAARRPPRSGRPAPRSTRRCCRNAEQGIEGGRTAWVLLPDHDDRPALAGALQEALPLAGEARLHESGRVGPGLLQREALEEVAARDERAVDRVQHAVDRRGLRHDLIDPDEHGVEPAGDLPELEDRRDEIERERQDDERDQQDENGNR